MQPPAALAKLSEFLHAPVAMTLAACADLRQPALARGIGCRLSTEDDCLWLFVSRPAAAGLLADLDRHPQIAAVFCLPSTEQAIQIKGCVVQTRPATESERAWLAAVRDAFAGQIAPLGYSPEFTAGYLHTEAPVALLVRPTAVYQQTPGPLAGSLLA